MRKVIYAINLTLDGCCDHTKGAANEEVHEFHANLLREVSTLAFGRITYQLMVPFWPDIAKTQSGSTKTMNDFASTFAAVEKIVVFSKSLASVENKNTTIVRTDPGEEILRLKQESGKDILVGGVDVPSQLIQRGLIDEYHFVFQPVLVGEGRRLLDTTKLPEMMQLKLAGTKTFKSGGIALRYLK